MIVTDQKMHGGSGGEGGGAAAQDSEHVHQSDEEKELEREQAQQPAAALEPYPRAGNLRSAHLACLSRPRSSGARHRRP